MIMNLIHRSLLVIVNKLARVREVILVRINNIEKYKLVVNILKKRDITIKFITIYILY